MPYREGRCRAVPVWLASGATYWTILDEDLRVVPEADAFLQQPRFGGDAAESTAVGYAAHCPLLLLVCTERLVLGGGRPAGCQMDG
jgi:hypothetical protein